jgi:hypothetical protein
MQQKKKRAEHSESPAPQVVVVLVAVAGLEGREALCEKPTTETEQTEEEQNC